MNEHLRDRILRKLEALSDERGYQVLDYAEFLESRYAERQSPNANTFTRFTEAIEDKLRAGKVSASAIAETMGFMNRAANVLNNAFETSRNVATEIVNGARNVTGMAGGSSTPGSSSASSSSASPPNSTNSSTGASSAGAESSPQPPGPPSTPSSASSPAGETKNPGAPGETL